MDTYSQSAWLIPLFPLVAFLVLTALGKSNRSFGVMVGIASAGLSLASSLLMLLERIPPHKVEYSYDFQWLPLSQLSLRIGFEVTNVITLMLAVFCFISLIIHIYAAGYLKDDERIAVFFSYLALFSFGMQGLIIADNLLLYYICGAIAGIGAVLLTGFWYANTAVVSAMKKSFTVLLAGDICFLLAIVLLLQYMPDHSLSFTMIQSVFEGNLDLPERNALAIAILLLISALSRAVQLPLHIWLTKAMEGPAPASAIIFSAGITASGIFLIIRTVDIFEATPYMQQIMVYIGAATMILAAFFALAQRRLKQAVSYSIISHMGMVVMAIGLGAVTDAFVLLIVHACFQAAFILIAGWLENRAGTDKLEQLSQYLFPQDKYIRNVRLMFGITVLLTAGTPLLGVFWPRSAILAKAWEYHWLVFAVGLTGSILTAWLMIKLYLTVFNSKESNDCISKASRTQPISVIPVMFLLIASLAAGLLNLPGQYGWLSRWLDTLWAQQTATEPSALFWLAQAIASAVGAGLAYLQVKFATQNKQSKPFQFAEKDLNVDKGLVFIAMLLFRIISTVWYVLDFYVINGVLQLGLATIKQTGRWLTRIVNKPLYAACLFAAALLAAILIVLVEGRLIS